MATISGMSQCPGGVCSLNRMPNTQTPNRSPMANPADSFWSNPSYIFDQFNNWWNSRNKQPTNRLGGTQMGQNMANPAGSAGLPSGMSQFTSGNEPPSSSAWHGTPGYGENLPSLNQGQSALQQQIIGMLSGMLGKQGNQPYRFDFSPIAAEAKNQFYTETVPTLAERFSAMGPGAVGSSGFKATLANAGANLNRGLASLGAEYGLREQLLNQNNLAALLSSAFHPAFNTALHPAQSGWVKDALPGAINTALKVGLGGI